MTSTGRRLKLYFFKNKIRHEFKDRIIYYNYTYCGTGLQKVKEKFVKIQNSWKNE